MEMPEPVLNNQGRDTLVRWYPLRIFHSSAKRQDELNELLAHEPAVEGTYVPRRLVDAEERRYVSALVNYIFVRTSLESLKEMKADKTRYDHLRYVMSLRRDENYNPFTEISYVPDKQMEDFMQVIRTDNEQVVLLENLGFACKPGQMVRITHGLFEGVEGTLKSIRKHLCVVIPIHNVMAVAITNVPRKYLQRVE